jgi:hypothetical protein
MNTRQRETAKKAGLQVVLGTGPVGCAAARHLLEEGLPVRMINRSGKRPDLFEDLGPDLQARLEVRPADAMNGEEVMASTRGATHIYHCANVSYERWSRDLPVLHANLVNAAVAHDAVLAVAENLYMYAPARAGSSRHSTRSWRRPAGKRDLNGFRSALRTSMALAPSCRACSGPKDFSIPSSPAGAPG